MGSAAYEERFSIPAEEQNAGRVVDYIFFRVEFHSTPGFFSDSNYLFFFFFKHRVVRLYPTRLFPLVVVIMTCIITEVQKNPNRLV